MLVLYALLIGSTCLFMTLIFLLHQWLAWWQSFAIVGLLIIIRAVATNAALSFDTTTSARARLSVLSRSKHR
jgi:hypothetical protein